MREIRIRHDDEELQDPQRITRLNQRILAAEFGEDLNAIHRHEVHNVIDDFDSGERILQIKKKKYFFR